MQHIEAQRGKVGEEEEAGEGGVQFEVIEERIWIPVRDGTRLAATLYRPKSDEAFPAILEYIPYRKDDWYVPFDRHIHYYLARRGYIGVRVDIRGTGSSEGVAENEYAPQEQLDGYDAVEWLAKQDWCTGEVGMWGISYGGYASVLVASHQPPSLKAIAPMYFTDDGYSDGDHYIGGCLNSLALGYYPMWMLPVNVLPTDPEHVQDDAESWEGKWNARLEQYIPWLLEWWEHPTKDEYWGRQILRPNYSSIKCPVFMFGAWGDHFRNSVPRMLEHLSVPRKAIIGPWVHIWPDSAYPGPNIDWLHELVRWWDHWLKGEDTGIMDEPMISIYVQRSREPILFPDHVEGEWRYEEAWPVPGIEHVEFFLRDGGRLSREPPGTDNESPDQYKYRPDVGVMSSIWYQNGCRALAQEQSLDEAFSLTYTTEPLEQDLEILGRPTIRLHAASSATNTAFVVKLTEVSPAEESNLITYGVLNAAHRKSHETPEKLEPLTPYEFAIEMDVISWVFKKGYRIRVSVTSADWPVLWPLPEPASNQVFHDSSFPSAISLPVVPERTISAVPSFRLPSIGPLYGVDMPNIAKPSLQVTRDVTARETIVKIADRNAFVLTDRKLAFDEIGTIETRVSMDNPAHASVRGERTYRLQYASGLDIEARGRGKISSNETHFFTTLDVDIRVNGQPHFKRSWLKTVPRYFI